MCCFSMPMRVVSETNIFVREAGRNRQFLVYSMNYSADREGAMVLPLPVPPVTNEDAVEFISLEDYEDFFTAMRSAFPEPYAAAPQLAPGQRARPSSRTTLTVHPVGHFEASFVPTIGDFDRLDPRFRIGGEVWDLVPRYRDYGFAVFKLRPERRTRTLHPMAMKFPRRDPSLLFVPTVHIHDGRYHARADFDHAIYCQTTSDMRMLWSARSAEPASSFMDVGKAAGLVDGSAPCFRRTLRGSFSNADAIVRSDDSAGWQWLEIEGESDLFFTELLLPNSQTIEACRRRHSRVAEPWFTGQSEFVRAALRDLRSEMAEPISRVREMYRLRAPRGLVNVDAFFESNLDSALTGVLVDR